MKKVLLIFFVAVVILTMLSPIYFIGQIDSKAEPFDVYMTSGLYYIFIGYVVIVEIELFRNIWCFVAKRKKKMHQQVFNTTEMVLSISALILISGNILGVHFIKNSIVNDYIELSMIIAYIIVKLIHYCVWLVKDINE